MGGASRYPMPPRNGAMQHRQLSGGGFGGPPHQRQHHHQHHHGGPMNSNHRPHPHGVPPPPSAAQQHGGVQKPQGHHHHHQQQQPSHMGNNHPKAPTSALMRSGHVPVHQPVPFRRGPHHPMTASGGGGPYHSSYGQQRQQPFNPHHHRHQQPPHHAGGGIPPPPQDGSNMSQHYPPLSRPLMDQHHRRQSMSRSPSPPPAPPSGAMSGLGGNNASRPSGVPAASMATADRRNSDSSVSVLGPLKERHNVQERKPGTTLPSSQQQPIGQKPPAAVDMTADAASILLELAGGKMAGQGHGFGGGAATDQENHGANQTSSFLDHKSNDGASNASIVHSGSSDGESTISPPDLANESCPPDLTSEPSSDNTEAELPQIVPENFPTRLALPHDDSKLNSLHCFLRSELLEIFVVQKSNNKSPTHSPGSSVGRVGLRCVHCALVRQHHRDDRDEAPMAVFYPKSIAEIYRLVTSWQRCHLRKCRNLPPPVRSTWQSLRDNDKSRGKTHYWVTSAKEIGLVDCQSRAGGIRFGPEAIKRFLEEAAHNDDAKDGDAAMADATTQEEKNEQQPPSEVTTTTVVAPPSTDEQESPPVPPTNADDAAPDDETASAPMEQEPPTSEVSSKAEPSLEPPAAPAVPTLLTSSAQTESIEAMLNLKDQAPTATTSPSTNPAESIEAILSLKQTQLPKPSAADVGIDTVPSLESVGVAQPEVMASPTAAPVAAV